MAAAASEGRYRLAGRRMFERLAVSCATNCADIGLVDGDIVRTLVVKSLPGSKRTWTVRNSTDAGKICCGKKPTTASSSIWFFPVYDLKK